MSLLSKRGVAMSRLSQLAYGLAGFVGGGLIIWQAGETGWGLVGLLIWGLGLGFLCLALAGDLGDPPDLQGSDGSAEAGSL